MTADHVGTCIAVVPGCAECQRTSRGRNEGHRCDDLCRMIARELATDEGHAAWHKTMYCSICGTARDDEHGKSTAVIRPCSGGRCREWHCPTCDALWMSDGPVSCPCSAAEPVDADA